MFEKDRMEESPTNNEELNELKSVLKNCSKVWVEGLSHKDDAPQRWLLAVAKAKSEECGATMRNLLKQLNRNSIPYEINEDSLNEMSDSQSSVVRQVYQVSFDLVIWPDEPEKTVAVVVDMPAAVLGQFEEIDGIRMATGAYEWLIKQSVDGYVFREGEEEAEMIERLSSMRPDRRDKHLTDLKKAIDRAPLGPLTRDRYVDRIFRIQEFFERPEAEQNEYLSQFEVKVDFDNMSSEERAKTLWEFDRIVRPIIGDYGFPDWTRPEFIDEILNQNK